MENELQNPGIEIGKGEYKEKKMKLERSSKAFKEVYSFKGGIFLIVLNFSFFIYHLMNGTNFTSKISCTSSQMYLSFKVVVRKKISHSSIFLYCTHSCSKID